MVNMSSRTIIFGYVTSYLSPVNYKYCLPSDTLILNEIESFTDFQSIFFVNLNSLHVKTSRVGSCWALGLGF